MELVLGKSGQLTIVDAQGREREKYILPNGARLLVHDGQEVAQGTTLAEWDPFNEPFVCEEEGVIRFTDIVDGKTVQEKVDDITRQASLTIMEYRTTNFRPSISICDENGNVKKRSHGAAAAVYSLPVGSIIMIKDGEVIQPGDIIARKPRETSKTKDIVGGLPRVAELFEVRKPKDMAVVSEISGTVTYEGESKGKRKLMVTPEIGEAKEYLVPKGKHITAADGDFVEAGDPLTEGYPELHDILRTRGEKYLARYLVDEIQEVYRFQGVGIDDTQKGHHPGFRRHQLPGGRTGGQSRIQARKPQGRSRRPHSGHGRTPGAGHYPGLTDHFFLHLGSLLPRDHQGAHRSRPARQGRPFARPEGKRHRGSAHAGRYRLPSVR